MRYFVTCIFVLTFSNAMAMPLEELRVWNVCSMHETGFAPVTYSKEFQVCSQMVPLFIAEGKAEQDADKKAAAIYEKHEVNEEAKRLGIKP